MLFLFIRKHDIIVPALTIAHGSFCTFTNVFTNVDQTNSAPVDELREAAVVTNIYGEIPSDFPDGVYIRNGLF